MVKRLLAVGKYIDSSILLLALTGLATAATLQSHPFSQIFPPDEDLGFGGKDIKNVSRVETGVVAANQSDLLFKSDADVTVLRYDESQARWELVNSDFYLEGEIDMNGNRITGVPAPSDPGDAVNKSYVDISDDTIKDDQTLQDVLSQDNSAGSYDIDMNGNDINNVGSADFDMVYDSGQSRIELRSNGDVPICIGAC